MVIWNYAQIKISPEIAFQGCLFSSPDHMEPHSPIDVEKDLCGPDCTLSPLWEDRLYSEPFQEMTSQIMNKSDNSDNDEYYSVKQ